MVLLVFYILLSSPVFSFVMKNDEVKFDTKIGAIIGKTTKVAVDGGEKEIAVFLGIPFAEPPIGTLR